MGRESGGTPDGPQARCLCHTTASPGTHHAKADKPLVIEADFQLGQFASKSFPCGQGVQETAVGTLIGNHPTILKAHDQNAVPGLRRWKPQDLRLESEKFGKAQRRRPPLENESAGTIANRRPHAQTPRFTETFHSGWVKIIAPRFETWHPREAIRSDA